MPSQFDNTYHNHFRRPVFDDESSERLYKASKEADEVFELRPPPIPTPEMEVEYIDFLQESFKSDPWITYRFRKYMASPKRIPWKNSRRIKRQYQYNFALNMAIGSALTWPLACMFGRRMKQTTGGVPIVHLNRFVQDFHNLDPGYQSRRYFKYYTYLACAVGGFLFATYMTNPDSRNHNKWYSRPDLKPYPAMVEQPDYDVTRDTMLPKQYANIQNQGEGKRSAWYRYFMARDADFTIKQNPYQNAHKEDIYDTREGHYSTWGNKFGEHHQ